MGVAFVEGTVTGPTGEQESLRFLVDSGVMYTLLPRRVWRAIGLRATDSVKFVLEDGTLIKRNLSECKIALAQGSRHTPVILGAGRDEAVLGRITLSEFGLMLNPFTRRLEPMRLMLAQQRRSAMPAQTGRRRLAWVSGRAHSQRARMRRRAISKEEVRNATKVTAEAIGR